MSFIVDRDGKIIGHVLRPRGKYAAQVRGRGCRKWRHVAYCKTAERAMSRAAIAMKPDDHRARVLFIDNSGWYEPNLMMEAVRK
jgi:hypothetical protein